MAPTRQLSLGGYIHEPCLDVLNDIMADAFVTEFAFCQPESLHTHHDAASPSKQASEQVLVHSTAPATTRVKSQPVQDDSRGDRTPTDDSAMDVSHTDQSDIHDDLSNSSLTDEPTARNAVSGSRSRKTYLCPLCNKVLDSGVGKLHIEKVHKKKWVYYSPHVVSCFWCAQKCTNARTHREHAQEEHRVNGEFPCPRLPCSRNFRGWPRLLDHVKTIHDAPPDKYRCSVCALPFRSKSTMTEHMRTHSAELKHQCAHCQQKFRDRSTLVKHIKTLHDAARPSQHVKRKVKIPDGKVAPRCAEDYMAFTYKCLTCKLGFWQKRQLIRHLEARHPDDPKTAIPELNVPVIETRQLRCTMCRRECQTKQGLAEHAARFHPGASVTESADGGVEVDGKTVKIKSIFLPWCVQCDMKFVSAARLQTHNNYWHSETRSRGKTKLP